MSHVAILLSDKRSGSTMFQSEFCRHQDVQTVPYSPHTYLETHWWLMSAVLLRRPGSLFVGGEAYRGYGSHQNARTYMLDLLSTCVPDFVPPNADEDLVFDGWEALCTAYARPVFFEKSPQILAHWAALSLLLEWMERTHFKVRIIGLVRNPHAVMYSAAQLFGSDPATRQFAWTNGCRNLLTLEQMVPKEKFLRVRYEDILPDPVESFAKIARFVGLEPDPACGSGTRGGSSEKWRNDPDYRLSLDPAVRQMANRFGYSATDLTLPRAAASPDNRAMKAPSMRRNTRLWLNRRRDRFIQPLIFRLKSMTRPKH